MYYLGTHHTDRASSQSVRQDRASELRGKNEHAPHASTARPLSASARHVHLDQRARDSERARRCILTKGVRASPSAFSSPSPLGVNVRGRVRVRVGASEVRVGVRVRDRLGPGVGYG